MAHATSWFSTSILRPEVMNNPTWVDNVEATMIHAKNVGTVTTACGRDTSTWHKHWETFNPAVMSNACPRCVEAVGVALRSAQRILTGVRSAHGDPSHEPMTASPDKDGS